MNPSEIVEKRMENIRSEQKESFNEIQRDISKAILWISFASLFLTGLFVILKPYILELLKNFTPQITAIVFIIVGAVGLFVLTWMKHEN